MLGGIGRFAARHHWLVLGIWVVGVVGAGVLSGALGSRTSNDFSIPGTDSQAALDILEDDFPALAGTSATVVFQAPDGSTVHDDKDAIEKTVDNLKKIPDAASASDPFDPANTLVEHQVSSDGTIAFSSVEFSDDAVDLPDDTFDKLQEAAEPAEKAGMTVAFGGGLVDAQNAPSTWLSDHADAIGLFVAFCILLIAFRSWLVAVLPILTALFGISMAGSLATVLEHGLTIPSVGPILGTMIGLGVGVDYSLFIVNRTHAGLEDDRTGVADAVGAAMATSGRAVLFAAITVCIATSALVLVGIPMVGGMGLTAAFYVVIMAIAAMTLLPALLGLSGRRLLSWRIGRGVSVSQSATTGVFARLAHVVTRHSVLFGFTALALLLVLAAPALRMQTGWVDDGDLPESFTQRQAYDLLTEGFGPGANAQVLVAIDTGTVVPEYDEQVGEALLELRGDIEKTDGVQSASIPIPDKEQDPDAFVIEVIPTTGPAASETKDLVRTLRATTIPKGLGETSFESGAHVGGVTAITIDLTDVIDDALPVFIAAVIGGSFLLLMLVFRSLLVPLKAAVMNVLSIGAAYGVVVAVFQWGWGKSLIGLPTTVDVVSFVPLMMFAILFGLSMDYEVFLMSRIQEEYASSADARRSVLVGLSDTGRVISSAALVMMAVFLSFVSNLEPTVKMIGLGLAVAVFIDATVVRLLLVPAVMTWLGDRAWWLPHWLDRILPRIELEAPQPSRDAPAPGPAALEG